MEADALIGEVRGGVRIAWGVDCFECGGGRWCVRVCVRKRFDGWSADFFETPEGYAELGVEECLKHGLATILSQHGPQGWGGWLYGPDAEKQIEEAAEWVARKWQGGNL